MQIRIWHLHLRVANVLIVNDTTRASYQENVSVSAKNSKQVYEYDQNPIYQQPGPRRRRANSSVQNEPDYSQAVVNSEYRLDFLDHDSKTQRTLGSALF